MYYAAFTNPPADQVIRENFFQDYNYKGVVVEVGCGPPIHASMSKHWRDNGWRSICIDPNPKFVEQHKLDNSEVYQYACADFEGKTTFTVAHCTALDDASDGVSYSAIDIRYPNDPNYPYQVGEVIEATVTKLNTLLTTLQIQKVDILCIDTEGWELDVMRGFDHEKYNPKVIVLENLYQYTPHTKYLYIDYMARCGYSLCAELYPNQIYVKND